MLKKYLFSDLFGLFLLLPAVWIASGRDISKILIDSVLIMLSQLPIKREALEDFWSKNLSGTALLHEYSGKIDTFLLECFAKIDLAGVADSVALVALGGYGRAELFPFSDIDLMIVYRDDFKERINEVADAVFYPLWDAGLDVGHGVRNIDEALQLSGEDFFFRVSMLDARFLTGSEPLYQELLKAYHEQFVDGKRQEFFGLMQEFRQDRCKKYGAHSYLLEPHIKDGKGGLRDIQSMQWTAQVVYGLKGFDDILDAGIFTAEEHEAFAASWDMLVTIRNHLHSLSKRKNDHLFFEQQEELADALSYRDSASSLAVEQFMRDVYGHMRNIAVTTDLFFDHVADILGSVSGKKQLPDREIEKGVELRGSTIRLTASREEITARPQLLFRVFLAAARCNVPIHHRTKKLITANLDCMTDKARSSLRVIHTFFAIFECECDLSQIFGVMLETGLLPAFLPEFERIHVLVQHDLYHIYTVDRHSIQAIEELRQVLPHQQDAVAMVNSLEVLRIAVLLHDIGKGSGRDHSEAGAEIVGEIGKRMGFKAEECDDLCFVVRYHLFLPENALRRDLNDGEFIQKCARQIGTANRLAMLYLTTIADSRATGPSAWSDWKASMLSELFYKVKPFLEDKLLQQTCTDILPPAAQKVRSLREAVAGLLKKQKGMKVAVEDLADDYLLGFSPENVVEHMCLHRDNLKLLGERALVCVREGESGEPWALLIMSADCSGLLAKICGVMTLHNLRVLNARFFTWKNGVAVDALEVQPTDGLRFAEKDWDALKNDLNLAVQLRLGLGRRLHRKLAPGLLKHRELRGRKESNVRIDNMVSSEYSVVEVFGSDIPGQLYHITQSFADFGINIYKAFIATEVEQLIDIFYVLDKDGTKLEDPAFIQEIRETLLYIVTGGEER